MHEYALTQNLLNMTLQHAEGKRVLQVNLQVGPFSDESEDSIQFYWSELSKGTNAESARLNFQAVPAEMHCLDCGYIFHAKEPQESCPSCFKQHLKMTDGDEVKLKSIDVE